jgi:hypothetical protein
MSDVPPTRDLMGEFEPEYDDEDNIIDFATGKILVLRSPCVSGMSMC